MPSGYDYYALRNLYVGLILAFTPGQTVPDTTVSAQGWVTGLDVEPIGTPPPTTATLFYNGTPTDGETVTWDASLDTFVPTDLSGTYVSLADVGTVVQGAIPKYANLAAAEAGLAAGDFADGDLIVITG